MKSVQPSASSAARTGSTSGPKAFAVFRKKSPSSNATHGCACAARSFFWRISLRCLFSSEQ